MYLWLFFRTSATGAARLLLPGCPAGTSLQVSLGGHLVSLGGQQVSLWGQQVSLGGQQASLGGLQVSLGGQQVSLGGLHFQRAPASLQLSVTNGGQNTSSNGGHCPTDLWAATRLHQEPLVPRWGRRFAAKHFRKSAARERNCCAHQCHIKAAAASVEC